MKQIFYTCIVICAATLFSCTSSSGEERFYSLKTIVPFSSSHYGEACQPQTAGTSETDEEENPYSNRYWIYDTLTKETGYLYDSIPEGDVTLAFFSLLTNNQVRHIHLNRDTILVFDTTAYSRLTKGNTTDVLNMKAVDIDTLFVGLYASGCGNPYRQKAKIFKADSQYVVQVSDQYTIQNTAVYTVPQAVFSKAFAAYIQACRQLFPDPKGSNIQLISTTQTNMYMRNGNTLYALPQTYSWGGFNDFLGTLEKYAPKTQPQQIDHRWDTMLVK